jgi:hypothetical protein
MEGTAHGLVFVVGVDGPCPRYPRCGGRPPAPPGGTSRCGWCTDRWRPPRVCPGMSTVPQGRSAAHGHCPVTVARQARGG